MFNDNLLLVDYGSLTLVTRLKVAPNISDPTGMKNQVSSLNDTVLLFTHDEIGVDFSDTTELNLKILIKYCKLS